MLSMLRNCTDVASEARPRFSTSSWCVNSGLSTVSRRSRFFSHLGRVVVRCDSHLSILAHGHGKHTVFFVWRKVLSRTWGFRVSRQAKAQQCVENQNLT